MRPIAGPSFAWACGLWYVAEDPGGEWVRPTPRAGVGLGGGDGRLQGVEKPVGQPLGRGGRPGPGDPREAWSGDG